MQRDIRGWEMQTRFYSTYKELKPSLNGTDVAFIDGFYSTYKELKLANVKVFSVSVVSSYSTYEELKLCLNGINDKPDHCVLTLPMRN